MVKQIGWPVSTSSTKNVWATLVGRSRLVAAVEPHVPLAEAAHPMGIDGQQPAPEVARGAADLAQGHLEAQAVGDGAGPEQVVDGGVGGQERQAVGHLEDPLVQGAAVPQPGAAQRRLVDQLQRQPRFHALGRLPVQPHTRSQAPSRSNSGTSSQMPARFPMTLSARNCRTPCSMLRGSQGTGLLRVRVVSGLDGRLRAGAVAMEFFSRVAKVAGKPPGT